MSRKRDIHVVPHDGNWATRKEGAQRAGSVYPTKAEALDQGREQAKRENAELAVHGRNGDIQDSDSYGNDPNPPKDQKH
jgi:hypothetical protein